MKLKITVEIEDNRTYAQVINGILNDGLSEVKNSIPIIGDAGDILEMYYGEPRTLGKWVVKK